MGPGGVPVIALPALSSLARALPWRKLCLGLAGLLLARFDYFTSFAIMGALLLIAIPVFVLGVDEGRDPTATAKAI